MMTRQDFCRLGGAFALAGRGLSAFADAAALRAACAAHPQGTPGAVFRIYS